MCMLENSISLLFLVFFVIGIVYFGFKRVKAEEDENFEDRDN